MKFDLAAFRAMALALVGTLVAVSSSAAIERGGVSKSLKPAEGHEEVELFAGIADGTVEVQFIPKDATRATVIFKNKTDRPISVRLPSAFAGVPVLAQGIGAGVGGMGGMGGGMGGMGGLGGLGGMGGMGGMGGFMNLAPEKVARVRVGTMCLEHGKEDPNPHIKYEIRPIAEFTDKPEVAELCRMIANDEIPQNVAQAAAWHLMDGLTWEQLAAKDRVRMSNGYAEKWFSYQELVFAQRAVMVASERAKAAESETTSSTGDAYRQ